MLKSFKDTLETDHLNMINSDEFGVSCLNTRTTEVFNIIKTDSFVRITEEGLAITEDKPMFNTSMKMKDSSGVLIITDILQEDILIIEGSNFKVRDVRKDGLGGFDIYLKD